VRKTHPTAYAAEIEEIFERNAGIAATAQAEHATAGLGLDTGLDDPRDWRAAAGIKSNRSRSRKRGLDSSFEGSTPRGSVPEDWSTSAAAASETAVNGTKSSIELSQPQVVPFSSTVECNAVETEKGGPSPPTKDDSVVGTLSEAPLPVETKKKKGKVLPHEQSSDLDGSGVEECHLPTALTPVSDPKSCLSTPILVLTVEEAFYSMSMDICSLCCSAGAKGYFLFCKGAVSSCNTAGTSTSRVIHHIDCGEAFHSFCVDVSFSLLSEAVDVSTWRCSNCKFCASCGHSSGESPPPHLTFLPSC
jgi:hypothetical protein